MGSEIRPRPGTDVTDLILAVGRDRFLRRVRIGTETERGMMGSANILLGFFEHHPAEAAAFAASLAVATERIEAALRELEDTKEFPSEPPKLPPEEQKLRDGIVQSRRAYSLPIQLAMRTSQERAMRVGDESYGLGMFLECLLEQDCEARTIVLRPASAQAVAAALRGLAALKVHPLEGKEHLKRSNKQIMEAIWPKAREDHRSKLVAKWGSDKVREREEARYAMHPEEFEEPFAIVKCYKREGIKPESFEIHKGGCCLHAAANEARMRKAPEVTLDHMFLALLQEGTDTRTYLEGRGADIEGWRRRLNEALPKFDDGPRWPPYARDLGMNIPSTRETQSLKRLPRDVDLENMTKEQREEYVRISPRSWPFTDLEWLRPVSREEETIGFKLLHEAGLTEDLIRAELQARKTGNPDWYRVRPDLLDELKEADTYFLGVASGIAKVCERVGQYEARLRWAPQVELEHILIALLVDGTDSSKLLDSLGIERGALREELDRALPKFESGPFFPELAEGISLLEISLGLDEASSDLKFLELLLEEPLAPSKKTDSVAAETLRRHGLTLNAVRARLTKLGVPLMRSWRGPS